MEIQLKSTNIQRSGNNKIQMEIQIAIQIEIQMEIQQQKVPTYNALEIEIQMKIQIEIQGVFHWYPPKKLKYGKPRLGESTLT